MTISDYLLGQARLLEATAGGNLEHHAALAIDLLAGAVASDAPILLCGNGGSAADAAHIAGELVGRYRKSRRPINAISLVDNAAVLTAWSNDYDFDSVFARQVEAYSTQGSVLWALSTSGNSPNIAKALQRAKELGRATLLFTGSTGGICTQWSDVMIAVPSGDTPSIQQTHICIYHYICGALEERLTDSQ